MDDLKILTPHRDYIEVYDAAENAIIGLEQDDFGIELVVNGGISSKPVTIHEVNELLAPGVYEVRFTPDTLGIWYYHITQPIYDIPGWKGHFRCVEFLTSDIIDHFGEGDRVVTVEVRDGDTLAPIQGALVEILTSDMSARVAFGYTGNDGFTTSPFDLFDGNYKITAKKFGYYIFSNPFDLVVSGDTDKILEGTAFVPDPAISPDLCVVYGWLVDTEQAAQVQTIKATLVNDLQILDSKQIVTVREVSTTSRSSDGYWQMSLLRTVESMDDDLRYMFTIDDVPVGNQPFTIPDQEYISMMELAASQPNQALPA